MMKVRNNIVKTLVIALAASSLFGTVEVSADHSKADLNKPYIALGADLDSAERAEVLNLLGVTEDELVNYTVATVTNEMEHEYLDTYLSAEVIGTRALSSVKVIGKEEGNGVKVTTKNISYCTTGMYQNALVTAGMEDAEVTVAGPFSISGTAALVGAMEAYENIIVADEIVDPVEIEETVRDTAEKLEISLSDEDIQQIVELMQKIADLDLDIDALKEQAKELYDKLASLDVDLNISESDVEGFFAKIGLTNLWEQIKGFFTGLF